MKGSNSTIVALSFFSIAWIDTYNLNAVHSINDVIAPTFNTQNRSDYDEIIDRAAARYGVDSQLIRSVIKHESNFDSKAISKKGAIGLMQLMPDTAKDLGVDPTDSVQNIDGGVRYLRQMLDRYGSMEIALAAYNAGPGAVDKYQGVPPYQETIQYISSVLADLPKNDFSSNGNWNIRVGRTDTLIEFDFKIRSVTARNDHSSFINSVFLRVRDDDVVTVTDSLGNSHLVNIIYDANVTMENPQFQLKL